jgi:membrane protein required for colicin V production
MNYFDLLIAGVLVWAFYSGYKKGIIYMLISFLSIIVGIYAAIHFSYLIIDWLADNLNQDVANLKILAYILTFLLVFGLLHLTGKILDKLLDAVALGFVNRLAGGLVSVGIRVVILSLLLWLFDQGNRMYPMVKQETLNESKLYNPIKDLSPVILVNLKKLQNNDALQELKERNFKTQQPKDTIK